ncbi:MAG: hypothetical protein KKD77_23645 [Gammaproteobacteria bacterium]|nr:hypothetical protein [Gammaproteobacteria bacterium]
MIEIDPNLRKRLCAAICRTRPVDTLELCTKDEIECCADLFWIIKVIEQYYAGWPPPRQPPEEEREIRGEEMLEIPEWMPENLYKCSECASSDCEYSGSEDDDICGEIGCGEIAYLAGCQKTARKLVEWLYGPCSDASHNLVLVRYRLQCPECMQQLRKEVGLESEG